MQIESSEYLLTRNCLKVLQLSLVIILVFLPKIVVVNVVVIVDTIAGVVDVDVVSGSTVVIVEVVADPKNLY